MTDLRSADRGLTLQRLSGRILNRSALARQSLLERATADVTTAVGRVGGLQAQYPNEPHIGLAARLEGFQPSQLNEALDRGDVIRATLMRGTIHIVTREQAAFALTSTGLIHHRAWHELIRSKRVPVDAMRVAVIKWCSEQPRTHQEIMEWLLRRFPEFPEPAHQIWRVVSATGDLIHAAPSGHFDNFERARYAAAAASVNRCVDLAGADQELVLCHLRAFGPATVQDVGKWSGLSLSRIRAALSRLELGPRFQDEDGNELFIADEIRVDGTEPAGARLLPAWDNVLIGYSSRARFLDRSLTHEVVHRNGDILPVVLLDGRVAATWGVLRRPERWQFRINPLIGLSRTAMGKVEDEAARVADSLSVVSEVLWLNP